MDGGSFCEPTVPLGQSCENHTCDFGATCVAGDGGATCQPYRELGEACDEGHGCKSALICASGQCSVARVIGEPCTGQFDCASYRCENRVCAQSVVGVGESCATAGCVSGAYCTTGSVCAAQRARGAGSVVDAECEAGSDCLSGVCRNRTIECR